MMTGAVLGVALFAAAACAGSSAASGSSLTFVSYGAGTYQNGQVSAWVAPYQQEKGSTITVDSPSDNAKIELMAESGNVTWDVVDTDAFFARQYCGKYLDKIDVGALASSFPAGTLTACGVPDALFGLELMYNTKTYPKNPPTSLADFFNPAKFPGKRIINGADPTSGLLEAALLGDGVAPNALYPLNVTRALKVYDQIKPDLTFATTYGEEQQAMVGNQADMALVVSARAYSVLKAGGTFWKTVWDKVPVSWSDLVIPKGSPHEDLAQQFIQYASHPAQAANFASAAGVGPANTTAKATLNALEQQVDPFSAAHKPDLVFLNANWWAQNENSAVTAWTNWMTG
jgi:putative spermidine/putrescine transport system substrate-binding protein